MCEPLLELMLTFLKAAPPGVWPGLPWGPFQTIFFEAGCGAEFKTFYEVMKAFDVPVKIPKLA